MTKQVGLIGLGLVGQALAERLQLAGIAVLGYDIRPEACTAFAAHGGQVAASPAQIGRAARCVVLAVFDTSGVIDVVEGPAGILSGGETRVDLVIDCSTGEPDALHALAARLQLRGVGLVEAPLSGSSQQIVPICISGNAERGRCFFWSVEKNAFQALFTLGDRFVDDLSLWFETHVD